MQHDLSAGDMHKVYDRCKGHTPLTADASGRRLVKLAPNPDRATDLQPLTGNQAQQALRRQAEEVRR